MKAKIGIKNYRVFKEMTEFEIRPLTLLIGPNNSGKSSFTKLLLLLKNGISNLKFKEGQHHLESFEKVLSWNSDSKEFVLRLPNNIEWLSDDYYVELVIGISEYSTAVCLKKITVLNDSEVLLDLNNLDNKDDDEQILNIGDYFLSIKDGDFNLKININSIIEKIYNNSLTYIKGYNLTFSEIDDNRTTSYENKYIYTLENNAHLNSICFTNTYKYYDYDIAFSENVAYAIRNETSVLEQDYLLYRVIVDDKDITSLYTQDIINLQTSLFQSLLIGNFFWEQDFASLLKTEIPIISFKIENAFKSAIAKKLSLDENKIEIKTTKLFSLIFGNHRFFREPDDVLNYCFFSKLGSPFNDNLLKNVEYIPVNRGNQKRILIDSENREISEIFSNFIKLGAYSRFEEYFNKVLQIFGIDGVIEVKRFVDMVSAVYVKLNDTTVGDNGEVSLADLGFGFSQLIPILLKTLNFISQRESRDSIFIIEEPEANLHPKLQSKLADYFVLTLSYFPEFHFVIETHSEYLIRKLQLHVAKKEIKSDDVIIHYFNSDEYVDVNNPKVKPIEIDKDGQLTEMFGPGFFDEATNMKYELIVQNAKSKQK